MPEKNRAMKRLLLALACSVCLQAQSNEGTPLQPKTSMAEREAALRENRRQSLEAVRVKSGECQISYTAMKGKKLADLTVAEAVEALACLDYWKAARMADARTEPLPK